MSAPAPSNAEVIEAYLNAVMGKDASVVDRFFAPDTRVIT
jgi:limonene-1,2-epoxide hydrolase